MDYVMSETQLYALLGMLVIAVPAVASAILYVFRQPVVLFQDKRQGQWVQARKGQR